MQTFRPEPPKRTSTHHGAVEHYAPTSSSPPKKKFSRNITTHQEQTQEQSIHTSFSVPKLQSTFCGNAEPSNLDTCSNDAINNHHRRKKKKNSSIPHKTNVIVIAFAKKQIRKFSSRPIRLLLSIEPVGICPTGGRTGSKHSWHFYSTSRCGIGALDGELECGKVPCAVVV